MGKILLVLAWVTIMTMAGMSQAAEPNRSWISKDDLKDGLRKEPAELRGEAPPPTTPLTLWYRQPAGYWVEALPLGNGRLGAMVFGGVVHERLQLNEDTIWDGYPRDVSNPDSLKALPEIRKLLFDSKNDEATKLAGQTMMGKPSGVHSYQPLGDLLLEFPEVAAVTNYRRTLDLGTGIATVTYEADGAKYTREIFTSEADDVLIVRLSCDKPGKINLTATLARDKDAKVTSENQGLVLHGQIRSLDESKTNRGVIFEAHLVAWNTGGKLSSADGKMTLEGADSTILLLRAATDYHDKKIDFTLQKIKTAMRFAGPHKYGGQATTTTNDQQYDILRAAHVAAHQWLFNRVDLNLGSAGDDVEKLPTDERLMRVRSGKADPGFAALYFQYGRYLLMSCSRPGGMPANLQGLWSWQMNAPWNADYHTNINIQMNYWPAEMCNLAECHEPLFDLMDSLVKPGEQTAKVQYGAGGWVVHHLTDPFGFTAPADWTQGIWPMGAAWLAQDPYEHYLFSGDKEVLGKRAYPLMKGAARFILDTLVVAPENTPVPGKLVTSPSVSPENTFIKADGKKAQFTYGVTMDLEIVHDLLTNCIEASTILNTDPEFRAECEKALKNLAPLQISKKDGRLQEWIEDYKDAEPQHRHVSHLFALHPGREITVATTPELAAAARKTLEARGDGGTGWSMAWKVNFWARLHDGDHAHLMLSNLLSKGTLPNMFDTHSPFQIDGNFGGTSGLAEMLLQSHARLPNGNFIIDLLPALPKAWPTGYIHGLRARGNVTVDLTWKDGGLAEARLTPAATGPLYVRLGGITKEYPAEAGKVLVVKASDYAR